MLVSSLSVCVSNGRAVHYNGSSLLQWKSVRLDVALLPGETVAKISFFPYSIDHFFCLIYTAWKSIRQSYGFEINVLHAMLLTRLLFQKAD